jgi:hypothetical protein
MTTTIQTSGDCRQIRQRSRTNSPDEFVLALWTNEVAVARAADDAGINRVGVDLERLGKAARQDGCQTWISPHTEHELLAVGAALTRARLFARVNPLNPDSRREIDSVLAAGAAVLMIPMIASRDDVSEFVGLVSGRANIILLVERREAVEHLHDLISVDGVDEVHVGMNDLALSLGMPNRWTVFASDLMTDASALVRRAGLPFGFGGIGRAGDENLPIPSDLIYAEYARTGATRALISRSFGIETARSGLRDEIARARRRLAEWQHAAPDDLAAAHADLVRRARALPGW